jgi:phospholipid/cholesterol/gamma-HCH transport system substrate-binding protein
LILIFVIIGLLVIIFGYLYLTGIFPGIHGYKAVVYFNDLSGLKNGSAVFIRGMEKGKVVSTALTDNGQRVKIEIILDKSITLTEDTEFAIRSLSLFGTDRILIVTPGNGKKATSDTKFYGINEVMILEDFFLKFDKLMAKLQDTKIDQELISLKNELFASLDSLAKGFIEPTNEITSQLAALVSRFDSITVFLKSEGMFNKMVTDPSFYNELRESNQSLKQLLEDIKTNPKKYFTVKIF